MTFSFRRLRAIARKEALQLLRDRRLLPVVFIAPVVQLTMLGYAASYDLKGVTLGVLDRDRSQISRRLVQAIAEAQTFEVREIAGDEDALSAALVRGELEAGMVLPADLTRKVEAGQPAEIAFWLDGSNATRALSAKGELTAILAREGGRLAAPVLREAGLDGATLATPIELVPKIRFNETLESRPFMVPGVLAMVLTVMTMILTAAALVRERERGTIEQIAVSPVQPAEWILGKLLPFIAVALVDVLLVTGVALFWFEVPLRGSFLLLVFLSGCYITSTLAGGLLISSVSSTQQQAMLTALLVMLPVILLSGVFYPIANMPGGIRAFSYLMPLRYFGVALRSVFLKGGGITVLWKEILAMLSIGSATLAFAIVRAGRRLG